LERVLRDYEQHWRLGDAAALAALFTGDGFVANRGGWIRGRNAIREVYQATSSALRLRAVACEVGGGVGNIIGA
jgi:nuclear transport factor 2 (NTF2) superfamily protein